MPAQALAKGVVISAADLTSRTLPSSQVFVSTVAEVADVVGLQTLRPLPANQPISKLHVRMAPLISRGQLVDFIYARGTVQLAGSAQALEDGAAGQTIRLLNPATRATLIGTVQTNGRVFVN